MTLLKENLEKLQSIAKERTVKTQTIEYDLETIVKKINKNVIKLNPDYQRNHRWTAEASSKLIESLILNIPVPFIYISQDIDVDDEIDEGVARYSVIDGQQRLTAISNFFNNKYSLTDLEVLDALNGCSYNDLPPFLIRRLEERSIRCLRIDSTLDQQVKYDIFERLNSGSVKLEPQELRNATCRGPFKALIKDLSKNSYFTLNANLERDSKRVTKMEDEELVLRYFAMTHNDGYKEYKSGFKRFLTKKMTEFNGYSDADLAAFREEFNQVMKSLNEVMIEFPFAKYKSVGGELQRMSKFNAAVFDAITLLAKNIYSRKGKLDRDEVLGLFEDDEFFKACEGSVNDIGKISIRINKAMELL